MFSRTDIPFLIAGAIASLALFISGVFAVAPYVAFLSSAAALNVALPVIFILFALSYKMIKQNKKPKENSKTEIKELNKKLREEKNTPVPIREELEDEKAKENKEKHSDLKRETDEISETTDNFAKRDEVEVIKKALSDLEAKFDESAKRIDSAATKDEVEEKLSMKFYAKGEERGWNTTFDNIILPNDLKEKLKEICKSQSGGYLLYGPPGTGKTSIGKAIANEAKLFAFISVSVSCLSNKSNIDLVFEKAETNSPCIIFIDKIDSIGKKPTDHEDVQSLNHLLTKLDGFSSEKNITVVAATNHKDHLDPVLIRGGRLDIHINIPALDVAVRRKILGERLKELSSKDIETIVSNTDGFSPANLIALIDHIKESKQKINEGK